MKRILLIALLAGCSGKPVPVEEPKPAAAKSVEAVAKNAVFFGVLERIPTIERVSLPELAQAAAIWGATGRDHKGTVYVGVSCLDGPPSSAHLLAIDDRVSKIGDVLGQLKAKPGASQNKIHTKIIQAADGYLYFASMDENGEREDGSKLPDNGSHFWRLAPGDSEWEHLGECPEAVIACAAGGRFIYFLSYFKHVLHQYDLDHGTWKQVVVGSAGGHVSRNFLVDARGHAFVPRVGGGKAELIEFDTTLLEAKSFPLKDYSIAPDASSHGIVGVAALKDGFLFTTDGGRLYKLAGGSLADLGPIHPAGGYAACLFSPDGERQAAALVNANPRGEPRYDWVTLDLTTFAANVTPLHFPEDGKNLLLYGSTTRDDAGNFLIAGRYLEMGKSIPVLYRLKP